jgi:methyl halide transferase
MDLQFLCAMPPAMRQGWARRMQELLSPSGILVCLEFPLYKDLNAVGPPWGLKGVYWDLLAEGKDGILRNSGSRAEGQPAQQGPCERVLYYKPERSYDQGRGTDMISVWKMS